jgi:hypothetical protein
MTSESERVVDDGLFFIGHVVVSIATSLQQRPEGLPPVTNAQTHHTLAVRTYFIYR